MEENNNELAIEMPALKDEVNTGVVTNVESAPVLSEKVEEPIISQPVVEPTPVVVENTAVVAPEIPVVQSEPVVTPTPIAEVQEPVMTAPVAPVMPVEQPTSVPEVHEAAPIVEPVQPAMTEAPMAVETPLTTPVIENSMVAPTATPTVEQTLQDNVMSAPVESASVVAPEASSVVPAAPENQGEIQIKKPSPRAQVIGTVIVLLLTAALLFWVVSNFWDLTKV